MQNLIKTKQTFDKMSHQAVKNLIKLTIINEKITSTVDFFVFANFLQFIEIKTRFGTQPAEIPTPQTHRPNPSPKPIAQTHRSNPSLKPIAQAHRSSPVFSVTWGRTLAAFKLKAQAPPQTHRSSPPQNHKKPSKAPRAIGFILIVAEGEL